MSKLNNKVFLECLDDAYKGMAWQKYALSCQLAGRKPDREYFKRRWAELKDKKKAEDTDV